MRFPARLAIAAGLALAGVTAFVGLSGMPSAQPLSAPASSGAAHGPIVVELFTSQSCSSCPPAEALFRDLAKRPDLVSLEWHVDYWDSLNVAGAGKWKDPYSSSKWTERQRIYAQNILHTGSVYTPEAVIDGAADAEGFNWGVIERKVADAGRSRPAITLSATRGEQLNFAITGAPAGTEATLVTFRTAADTDVRGGENKGRKLASSHIVIAAKDLGEGASLTAPLPGKDEGCAILLHRKNQGQILAAAYCPA
ncbi:MAG TPA: DUF1223 domain-containing protein [Hyphomonadaceae bacterium]|nr:DUF1223 domain-containing protein [Hyphomonadaceae bacterium]